MDLSTHPKLTAEQISTRLEDLRARFLKRAFEDRDAIKDALRQQDRVLLRDRAHRLAGTAPSFGLKDVGEVARSLDEILQHSGREREVEEAARKLIELLGRCRPHHH